MTGIKNDKYTICEDWLVENLEVDDEALERRRKDMAMNRAFRAYICTSFEKAMRKSHFKFHEGNVYYFDGKCYRRSSYPVIGSVVGDVMERRGFPHLYRVETRDAVIKHVSGQAFRDSFRPEKNLISFKNQVYDLAVGDTLPHSPELPTTTYLDFVFKPTATCPKWMNFLHEVLESDEKIIQLQEYLGAAFLDRTKYKFEHILFLVGKGQNGKGVFTNVIKDLFGLKKETSKEDQLDCMVSTYSPQEVFIDAGREYKASAINGKILNICEDMSEQDFSGGEFKKAISGEFLSARDPYGKPFTATQIPLFIASLNKHPRSIQDTSEGNYRRYVIINFDVHIPNSKKDTQLVYKLLTEKSGIINWIFEGYQRVIKNGGKLTESALNEAAVEKLRVEQDSRLRWMKEERYAPRYVEGSTKAFLTAKDAFNSYRTYCNDNNYRPFGAQEFQQKMIDEEFEYRRGSFGMGYWVYQYSYQEPITKEQALAEGVYYPQEEEDDDLPF